MINGSVCRVLAVAVGFVGVYVCSFPSYLTRDAEIGGVSLKHDAVQCGGLGSCLRN